MGWRGLRGGGGRVGELSKGEGHEKRMGGVSYHKTMVKNLKNTRIAEPEV